MHPRVETSNNDMFSSDPTSWFSQFFGILFGSSFRTPESTEIIAFKFSAFLTLVSDSHLLWDRVENGILILREHWARVKINFTADSERIIFIFPHASKHEFPFFWSCDCRCNPFNDLATQSIDSTNSPFKISLLFAHYYQPKSLLLELECTVLEVTTQWALSLRSTSKSQNRNFDVWDCTVIVLFFFIPRVEIFW